MSIEQKQFFEAGVKAERQRIVDLLLDGDFVDPRFGNTGLMALFYYLVSSGEWLSDKDIHALHHKIIDAIDMEEE